MIQIQNIDIHNFSLNGFNYKKVFIAIPVGINSIKIVCGYDSILEILQVTKVSEIEVDGVVYANSTLCINALKDVLFSKETTYVTAQFKIYNTLAEAQALDPKPENGILFQVRSITDPNNSGYYSFQSLEANGTKFEYPFIKKSTAIEAGNDDYASSGQVFTVKEDIEVEITKKVNKTTLLNNQFVKDVKGEFIKELYITGWNTGDLFLSGFNNNDAGDTLSFHFRDGNDDRVIYNYQNTKNQNIYELQLSGDAGGSGFGGFIVFDWTGTIPTVQGAERYQVNEKAKQLSNSPYIKAHFEKINSDDYADQAEADAKTYADNLTENLAEQVVYKSKENINQKVFTDSANHPDIALYKKFITDLKRIEGLDETETYYVDRIARRSSDSLNDLYDIIQIRIKKSDGSVIFDGSAQLVQGIETFRFRAPSDELDITVDWDNLHFMYNGDGLSAGTLANASFYTPTLFAPYSFQSLANNQSTEIEIKNIFKNYQFQLAAPDYTVNNEPSWATITYVQNQGITFDIVNYTTGRASVVFDEYFVFKPKDYLAIQVKYKVNSTNMDFGGGQSYSFGGNNSAGFEFQILRAGLGTSAKFGGTFVDDKNRTQTQLVKIDDNAPFSGEYRINILTVMTALENSGVDLNFTIEEICIYTLGNEDITKDKEFFESLTPQNLDHFLQKIDSKEPTSPKKISPYADIANRITDWYSDKTLFVYSASVWETQIQARYIAERKGMYFDTEVAGDGKDGYRETTLGGSQLTPIINGNPSKEAGDSHFARIVTSWEHYVTNYGSENGNVVILPFGYNHPGIDTDNPTQMRPFISGGVAREPLDYGLDRATNPPFTDYVNYEFDLVSDPTIPMRTYDENGVATNNGVPSYGSCLRGIIEFILSKDPTVEIFLPIVYGTSELSGATRDAHERYIKVHLQVALEYGFSAPRLDLRAGVNSFTKARLLKDAIHPNYIVGIRSAMAVLAEMN